MLESNACHFLLILKSVPLETCCQTFGQQDGEWTQESLEFGHQVQLIFLKGGREKQSVLSPKKLKKSFASLMLLKQIKIGMSCESLRKEW